MITEKNAREIESDIRQPRQLTAFLPWIIAAAALIVYLATLNHWISPNSIAQVAKVSGWTWQPELYGPLYWLVTYPFRWLPVTLIPLALNLLATLCAVLTLALLARSVALLPHDRTHQQRLRETSDFSLLTVRARWLPPVLATLVCGLQLTFWENATAASSEILDLLLFAYVIRNVLEYRIDERESWLLRAAFVYGLAIPNNWAMIGFFPLFIVALVWIKGLSFFNLRFLGTMALCGLFGLILYLLLPLTQMNGKFVQVPFWAALKANIGGQKSILAQFLNKNVILHGDQPLWVLSLFALVPLLLIAIRWPSYFGDTSRMGIGIATSILNLLYGVFLLVCVWVALDPRPSPRNYRSGLPPLLTFYYLSALCAGYFSGHFLLVFGTTPGRSQRIPSLLRAINKVILVGIWFLFLIAPAVLFYRNLPQIRLTNGPMFQRFTSLVNEGLPSQGAVILSDDPRRTLLLKAAMVQRAATSKYVLVDTGALKWPQYHHFLKVVNGSSWPSDPPKEREKVFSDNEMLDLVSQIATTNAVYYLHPSFGYYFELLCLEPHGLVYKVTSYPTNALLSPPLKKELLDDNETFWSAVERDELKPLLTSISPASTGPGFLGGLMARAHLDPVVNRDASILGNFYSRSLDYWGVEMQKHHRLAEAATHFETALELNPENIVAEINLECNKMLQAGRKPSANVPKSIEDQFGKYRNWEEVMRENGPFDEPNFCFEQGRLHARFQLFRQAANQFQRVKELVPDHLPARLWLTQLYIISNMPDEALKLIDEIHSQPQTLAVRTNRTELLFVEASAYLAKNDLKDAQGAVQAVLEKYPEDEDLLATAAHVYMTYGRYSNALAVIEQQLKLTPDNPSILVNKGYACLQLNAFEEAIPPLTKALALETNNYPALLNRAIAYFRGENFDAAQRDYEALQKVFPTAFQVYFGLGEIYYRKKDTNAAIRNYQLYLTNSPSNNQEAKFVTARLRELTPPSH